MSIHNAILTHVVNALQAALIDDIPEDDPARAGVVMKGPLQGSPDPDEARISVTVSENDPDSFYSGAVTGMSGDWNDEPEEIECGGAITWRRRFTVRARCLLVNTMEGLEDARDISSTLRDRIEEAMLEIPWAGVVSVNEFVSRGVLDDSLKGEMIQGGGPDAYDYHIKVRFEVLSTKGVTLP